MAASPLRDALTAGGGSRVVMPSEESVRAREEKKRAAARRPVAASMGSGSLEETRPGRMPASAPAAPSLEETRPGVGEKPARRGPVVNLEETRPGRSIPAPAAAPAGGVPGAGIPVSAPAPATFAGGGLPRRSASALQEVSPFSEGVLAHLRSRLPETLNLLPPAEGRQVVEKLRAGAAYAIGSQLARGAESILYQGSVDGYNFLVKSIRNWKDHWLGDVRTRKDEGRLSGGVAYATKVRHLTNEWSVGQNFQEDEGTPVPVQFYSLRKVSRLGLELGWDLLMERINGVDLADKRLLAAMTLEDKVKLCIRMAQAISVLHQKRFIHLDIKPSNFMLDRQGRVRLIDFGISVSSGFQSRTVAGTAGYFSPEQVSCRPLGEDTDIFALGITFNVLFGGRILLQSPDEAKSRQVRHDAASDLEKNTLPAVSDIPELTAGYRPLAEVIRECTIYRRLNRIGNCTQLISRLRQAALQCGFSL
ncbi:MAG: protein kinase [Oligosphaeraceae bacterium]